MKRIGCLIMAVIIVILAFPVFASAEKTDFLIGDWSTSDGVYLSFYDDGYFEMEWGYFPAEDSELIKSDILIHGKQLCFLPFRQLFKPIYIHLFFLEKQFRYVTVCTVFIIIILSSLNSNVNHG